MATNAERRAATRAKLITAARERFARDGFDATHTNDILADAGVSRGAMYHHFPSKRDLFEAVFVAVSEEAIDHAVSEGVSGESPLDALLAASLAWLDVARRREVAAILLDQGPQVLGWKRARDLEAEASLGLMKRGLQRAARAGELQVPSIDLAARLLNAALAEAALAALHDEPATSVEVQEAAIAQLINGMRT